MKNHNVYYLNNILESENKQNKDLIAFLLNCFQNSNHQRERKNSKCEGECHTEVRAEQQETRGTHTDASPHWA